MALSTNAPIVLTTTWQKVANVGESFVVSVLSGGKIWLSYSASSPAANIAGHPLLDDESVGGITIDQNLWIRADKASGATVTVSIETP